VDLDKILKEAQESGQTQKYSLRSVDSIEEDVRVALLKMLDRGAKPSGSLRKALLEREHPVEIVDQVIARFIEVGLIDDYALARELALSMSTRKGKAKGLISIELREKGFSKDAIDEAIAEIDADSELEAAKVLAVSRMSRMADLDNDVRSRRVAGYLSRKGYASNVVWAAIRFATDSLVK